MAPCEEEAPREHPPRARVRGARPSASRMTSGTNHAREERQERREKCEVQRVKRGHHRHIARSRGSDASARHHLILVSSHPARPATSRKTRSVTMRATATAQQRDRNRSATAQFRGRTRRASAPAPQTQRQHSSTVRPAAAAAPQRSTAPPAPAASSSECRASTPLAEGGLHHAHVIITVIITVIAIIVIIVIMGRNERLSAPCGGRPARWRAARRSSCTARGPRSSRAS